MTLKLVLRYRDVVDEFKTTFEHRLVLDKHGSVWWGWWKKDDEPDQASVLHLIRETAERERIAVGFYDQSVPQYYIGQISDCSFAEYPRPTPDPARTPEYYNRKRCAAWFKLSKLQEAVSEREFVRHFGPVPVGENTLFAIGYAGIEAASDELVSEIAIPEGAFLHLSDIHFGGSDRH